MNAFAIRYQLSESPSDYEYDVCVSDLDNLYDIDLTLLSRAFLVSYIWIGRSTRG